ncbi:maleylpyruvate isomerase family mycothiol-dependent enzyme [Streptomyces sp. NPDC090025]|uniref:maleylpyruvate isomerase family mycothiol-dependent enzyme n=1 Tax=Streptomyces sp. NPDC090025 TaxID=3365922 RepID=UPI003832B6E4
MGVLPDGLDTAIRDTAREIADLVLAAPGTGGPVPRSAWTFGEAAAHLGQANRLMADLAAGEARPYGDGTPQSLAAANEVALAAFPERSAGPLAELIHDQALAFLDAVENAGPEAADEVVETPLGPLDRARLGGYLLTHMLGHGYDLARALGRRHMLDRARVELTLPFMTTVMPRVTDPAALAGLTARYRVRLWGGAEFGVVIADGAVAAEPGPFARPDCTVLTEPVAFLLMALGRIDPVPVMATGRALAWGRKPWLGPRFPRLFVAP